MSMFHPNREYAVTVFDNQNRNSKEQFVAVNFEKFVIPIGKQTSVPGRFLSALEDKGSFLSAQTEDVGTGQVRSDPYARWMPRFSITTHGMADMGDMSAVPLGGVVLEAPKPASIHILGRQREEPDDAEAEVERVMSAMDRSILQGKNITEVRGLCASRGIRYKATSTKEELINLLVGEE